MEPVPHIFATITISVALCNKPDFSDLSSRARFFATNNSALTNPGPNSAEKDVFELIPRGNGIARLILDGGNGGNFAVHANSASQTFEVGVSDDGASFLLHNIIRTLYSSIPILTCMCYHSAHPPTSEGPTPLRRLDRKPSNHILSSLFPTPNPHLLNQIKMSTPAVPNILTGTHICL